MPEAAIARARALSFAVTCVSTAGCIEEDAFTFSPSVSSDDDSASDDHDDDEGEDDAPAEGDGGSSGEPPEVDDVAPTEGPFGTEVVIEGEHLLGASARPRMSLAGPATAACCIEVDDDTVLEWTDTEIRVRWPFPYDGEITIETDAGTATAGTFTPTWRPGPRWQGGSERITSLGLASGGVAAVVTEGVHATLVVFDDGTLTTRELGQVNQAALFEDAEGNVGGYFLRATAAERELWEIPTSGAPISTGHTTPLADAVLAAGLDIDGSFAWIRTASGYQYVRVRPDASGWSVDRGPIAGPQPYDSASHSASANADGTLVLAWADYHCDFLGACWSTNGWFAALEPDASAFGAPEQVFYGAVDRTRLRPVGEGQWMMAACDAQHEDWWNGTLCRSRVRTADAEWADLTLPQGGSVARAHTFGVTSDGRIAAAYCTDDGLRFATDDGSSEIARWPCQSDNGGILGDLFVADGTPVLFGEWVYRSWYAISRPAT